MNKKELLDQLLKDQREGKLKDPKFITKVELQYRDPEPEKKEPEKLEKMYGGAHTWRGGSYPGGNKSADQMAEEKRITEQSQKEISEVPEHLHDHYKAMRRGGLYGGSKGLTHEAAKQVLTLATGPGSGVTQAASILMDRGHNASQARQVIGDIQASHKRGK